MLWQGRQYPQFRIRATVPRSRCWSRSESPHLPLEMGKHTPRAASLSSQTSEKYLKYPLARSPLQCHPPTSSHSPPGRPRRRLPLLVYTLEKKLTDFHFLFVSEHALQVSSKPICPVWTSYLCLYTCYKYMSRYCKYLLLDPPAESRDFLSAAVVLTNRASIAASSISRLSCPPSSDSATGHMLSSYVSKK